MDPQRRLLPEGGCEALRAASLDKAATKASRPSIAQSPRIHSSGALTVAMTAAARADAAVCMSVLASACARPRLFCARRRSPPPLRAGRCELRVRAACILLAVCFFRGGAGSRSRVSGCGARAAMGVHSRDHIFSTSRRLWLWTSGVFRTKDLCSFVRRSHLCLKTLMGSGCRPSLCRQARFLPRKTGQ